MIATPDFIREASARPGPGLSFSGLTLWGLVLQSHLCHPDWDVDIHVAYAADEFADPEAVIASRDVIAWWLATEWSDHPAGMLGRTADHIR